MAVALLPGYDKVIFYGHESRIGVPVFSAFEPFGVGVTTLVADHFQHLW